MDQRDVPRLSNQDDAKAVVAWLEHIGRAAATQEDQEEVHTIANQLARANDVDTIHIPGPWSS